MNNLKRVLIIALCSILCVCTVPRFSFRSEAASTATYALYETLLNLSGYLTTRGYSIVHEHGSSIPSIIDLQNMTYENMGQLLFDFALKLNNFGATHDLPDLGDQFINAISEASFRGSIVISKQVRDLVDLYLSTELVNGSISVGSVQGSVSDIYNPGPFSYRFFYTPTSSRIEFYIPTESLCFRVGTSACIIPRYLDDYTYNALTNQYRFTNISPTYSKFITINGAEYEYIPYYNVNFALSIVGNIIDFTNGIFNQAEDAAFAYLRGENLTTATNDLVISQITDTSNVEVLSSTNTIDSDTADVEGPITIYLPSQSIFESLIDQYNENSLSYEDFIKALGLSSVSSDSTVSEKENALASVVYPTEDYLWFTKTQWGADSLEETRKASASTRAEEDSLADSIANTANGGSDPEDPDNKSRGKGLLALLLIGLGIWSTPIIAGDGIPSGGGTDDDSGDGSGDTSGYLAESIAGMAVAGSLVDDLFDSAGGSDGYGLIYTVGASFVIFSVIIGAANYFGALFHGSSTKQNIKTSGKKSTRGK